MPRYFAPISQEDLREKIMQAWRKHYEYEHEQRNAARHGSFGETLPYAHMLLELTPTIERDLGKVSFDCENFTTIDEREDSEMKDVLGFHTLDNGFTFTGLMCGGDWEESVIFIIYWDGTKLRGYIPTDGNGWNITTRQAYGNDQEADERDIRKRFPPEVVKVDAYGEVLFEQMEIIDPAKLLADIKERIQPKG